MERFIDRTREIKFIDFHDPCCHQHGRWRMVRRDGIQADFRWDNTEPWNVTVRVFDGYNWHYYTDIMVMLDSVSPAEAYANARHSAAHWAELYGPLFAEKEEA